MQSMIHTFLLIVAGISHSTPMDNPSTAFDKKFEQLKSAMKKLRQKAGQVAKKELKKRMANNDPGARLHARLKSIRLLATEGESIAKEALALVKTRPKDQKAFEVMYWLMGQLPYSSVGSEVADLLIKHHLTERRVETLVNFLELVPFAWVEKLAQAQVQAKLPRRLHAFARMNLAQIQLSKAESCEQMAEGDVVSQKLILLMVGKSHLDILRKQGAKHFREEALNHFRKIRVEFGNLKIQDKKPSVTFGEWADEKIRAITKLAVGMPAPITKGKDLDGKPLSLKQYRGKVVILVFWASWCAPCMAEVPHLKKLALQMKQKPFALIGVNVDRKLETAKKIVKDKQMTWPSFFNEGPQGPLTEIWDVGSYPTVIVLDHQGIIRANHLRGEALDRKIEELIKKMETNQDN